ncbi:S-4TM family putative pore-forming effector [Streptomyces sp. NBC_00683]|uniref:S-4TM family putative pore-forming effector n=1 Tax=Streptomyces sp. NBC_00683 TaxID=2903670 RepID=UPI002E343A2F|nr:S-4TM family putative pore-forming effector [Streptomyces sp. NBC_00683]
MTGKSPRDRPRNNSRPTNPFISEAQNTERSVRLLAAQRRLYQDAKLIHNIRLTIVLTAGAIGVSLALYFPAARAHIGFTSAAILLLISVLGSAREKRKSKEAASVQEEFDTSVFQLPWNSVLSDRPTNALVVEAAHRHKGGGLENWYGNTSTLVRPLDILVCQRSNLAWGVSSHRRWAAVIMSAMITWIAAIVLVCYFLQLSFASSMFAVVTPLVPTFREYIEMWRSNAESVQVKEKTESKISEIWESALEGRGLPSIKKCREIQDRLCLIRQTNAIIPDWFYWIFRKKAEKVMRVSSNDYVDQARTRGLA